MITQFRLFFLCQLLIIFILIAAVQQVYSQYRPIEQPDIWKQEMVNHSDKKAPSLPWYSDYDVVFTRLDLHLERNTVYVEGNVLTHAYSRLAGLNTYLCELVASLTVDSVKYQGFIAPFVHQGDSILVTLDPQPALDELFSIQIFYHGLPPTGGFFAGITAAISQQWGNDVMWTLSEPSNAYQWWPCKQDLTDKYDSSYFFITTDSSNKAGSNGLLTAVTPMPDHKLRYEWKERYPIDYYLISAAVADYQEYDNYAHPEGMTDSVFIQHFIYDAPGCLAYYKNDLDLTPYFIELFSHLFGPYPFAREKYGHCQTNLGGGMEHQTMGTVGAFNFHLNCHELSHQWFGDHVTCATWNDIWLNEGFATYAQYLALQYLTVQAYADTLMMGIQNYVKTESGGSVYIPDNQVNDVFRIFNGRLSYNKGAAIIQVLRGEINNDSLFFQVLKQYMNQYSDSVATGLDFKQLAETVTSMNFTDFFNQWYFGEGYPIFDVLYGQVADTLSISFTQTTSSVTVPLFKMYMEILLKRNTGDTLIRVYINELSKFFKIPIAGQVTGIVMDPHYYNLYKINSINRINEMGPENSLIMYPNPLSHSFQYVLNLQNTGPFEAVIYDMEGRIIFSQQLHNHSGTIDTDFLSRGIYTLEIKGKSFVAVKKIIKQ